MKFKTKVAYSAVLATLSLAAGTAQAAYLSEQGTGQVLLYPYFTVQNGSDTYISVVNTTSVGKAVKVRFLEGKNSREVLDFNLYLSAYDVWAAAVTSSSATDSKSAAQLVVPIEERSCTSPQFNVGASTPVPVPFRNSLYSGSNGDPYEEDLGRTREGYVEIIEMGVPIGSDSDSTGKPFAWRIKHDQSKSPAAPNDCKWVTDQWIAAGGGATPGSLAVTPPVGGLIGSATLINVANGVDYSYEPTAIEDFSTSSLHYAPGNTLPTLANADPSSLVETGFGTSRRVLNSVWTSNILAIDAILQRSNVMNEYYTDADVAGATDWVVTFPTKRFHVGVQFATAPFTKPYGDATSVTPPFYTKGKWNACEDVSLAVYNREELPKSGAIDFSPSVSLSPQLCHEANVINFGRAAGDGVLGSTNVERVLAPTSIFTKGWVDMGLTAAGHAISGNTRVTTTSNPGAAAPVYYDDTVTYAGLPTIGFSVQKYVNGTFNGTVGNYGGAYAHKYRQFITAPAGL